MLQKLNRTEDSDNIIEELKNQLRIETDRKHRVRFENLFLKSQKFKKELSLRHKLKFSKPTTKDLMCAHFHIL